MKYCIFVPHRQVAYGRRFYHLDIIKIICLTQCYHVHIPHIICIQTMLLLKSPRKGYISFTTFIRWILSNYSTQGCYAVLQFCKWYAYYHNGGGKIIAVLWHFHEQWIKYWYRLLNSVLVITKKFALHSMKRLSYSLMIYIIMWYAFLWVLDARQHNFVRKGLQINSFVVIRINQY